MVDPASVTAIKTACDFLVGSLPKIFPLVHDEKYRNRFYRVVVLIQRVAEDEILTTEELAEARRLIAKVRVHAIDADKAGVLAYLKEIESLLEIHKLKHADQPIGMGVKGGLLQVQSTTLQAFCESQLPAPDCIESDSSAANIDEIDSSEKPRLLLITDASASDEVLQAESPLSACTQATSSPLSPTQDSTQAESPVSGGDVDEKQPYTCSELKKSVCMGLMMTVGPFALFVPQVRRNLCPPTTV